MQSTLPVQKDTGSSNMSVMWLECEAVGRIHRAALTMSASRPQGTSAPRTRAEQRPSSPYSWMISWVAHPSSSGRCRTLSATFSWATSSQGSSTRWALSEQRLNNWGSVHGPERFPRNVGHQKLKQSQKSCILLIIMTLLVSLWKL